ncbi:MAG: DNA-protecting protein DprA [Rhodospirillales bacterium]|nr:DNA-protecting protein DprA [Rhodospirillales bacterium]
MSAEPRSLTASERIDWLRLSRSENVGPVTFARLLERFGTAGAALDALPDLARRGGRGAPITIPTKAAVEREIEAHERLGARLLARVEPSYPQALAVLPDAPPLISVRGQASLLNRPAIAVVGARNASANGRRLSRDLAAALGTAGLVVVSGMARGIDTAAHEGAMATGTVCVLAGGVDVVYPPENGPLYGAALERGALVAEMPVGTTPQASHFPRRNRVISGMAMGVVVVEATLRSGSLITARLALDQGREVFAVPGSPLDPRSSGPNNLIRQGATLVEGADDILGVLGPMLIRPLSEPSSQPFAPAPQGGTDESEVEKALALVVEALGPSPVAVDEIIRQCQLSPSVMSMVLLELELAGRLDRHPGNQVSLRG